MVRLKGVVSTSTLLFSLRILLHWLWCLLFCSSRTWTHNEHLIHFVVSQREESTSTLLFSLKATPYQYNKMNPMCIVCSDQCRALLQKYYRALLQKEHLIHFVVFGSVYAHNTHDHTRIHQNILFCTWYGMALVCRIDKMIGLFCKRALQKRQYSAKETYDVIDPTDCSHPISTHKLHQNRFCCISISVR